MGDQSCQCAAGGSVPGKANAPASLVNKGKQGLRYVAVTVGFEPIADARGGQGDAPKTPENQAFSPSCSQVLTRAHRYFCTKMHHGGRSGCPLRLCGGCRLLHRFSDRSGHHRDLGETGFLIPLRNFSLRDRSDSTSRSRSWRKPALLRKVSNATKMT